MFACSPCLHCSPSIDQALIRSLSLQSETIYTRVKDGGGAYAKRELIWCLCYNLTSPLPLEHAFIRLEKTTRSYEWVITPDIVWMNWCSSSYLHVHWYTLDADKPWRHTLRPCAHGIFGTSWLHLTEGKYGTCVSYTRLTRRFLWPYSFTNRSDSW